MASKTKTDELRTMTEDELESRLSEAKQSLFNLRFRHVTGQLPSSAELSRARKEIARINTILREREIEAAEAAEAAEAVEAVEGVRENG